MGLPDLSNSMYVAKLRYIQSIHEMPERQNPDHLVRWFLPRLERWRWARLRSKQLSELRLDPFYYYLLARTRYYDGLLQSSVAEGVRQFVAIGCGSDTRSHRFQAMLNEHGVRVLECDQLKAIRAKRRLASRWSSADNIEYLPIDLNRDAWPDLDSWLSARRLRTLVMMEGVSPYIDTNAFGHFLSFLARRLVSGSYLAYDFKQPGVGRGWNGKAVTSFRLISDADVIHSYHNKHGLILRGFESSDALSQRLIQTQPGEPAVGAFREDGLVRAEVP
jgi:methyltransferase (TIGR00027 family)